MTATRKLRLVLCWHMHQPDYRNALDGRFELPWTYLHATKDYTDMAWHLENNPGLACVVNFAPSLVDQLEDYTRQFATGTVRDPLLALLQAESLDDLDEALRQEAMAACFRCNYSKMIEPFPAYLRLYQTYTHLQADDPGLTAYLSSQFLCDLLVWYHLAWIGESVRRADAFIQRLMAQGSSFSAEDRLTLFRCIGELVAGILPRYRALQERGQVELSATPHHHPILPLMIDFSSAREALPDITLPASAAYPGGRERAEAQVASGISHHAHVFGKPPRGLWPAEGSVSGAALDVMAGYGCTWIATGENVLANSLSRNGLPLPERTEYLYQPYRYATTHGGMLCFFRDDTLSDRIGFEYAKWHSRDAVNDFIQNLEHLYQSTRADADPVVTVILDGENAWEYYPYNGYYFLGALYEALAGHSFIVPDTFSGVALRGEQRQETPATLETLVAGSWVYGTFSTWIGNPDKNAAWDLLVEAKQRYDEAIAQGRLNETEYAQATRQLSICEGSDWFWWFGDYNAADSVRAFDRLYRLNLANLYHLLKLPVPAVVHQPLSAGSQAPDAGGAMRRGSE
ncbi:MAG: glycoside hydrolase [Betaproteobacteria bacterium]|nr:glycoside hydrolase [Betaproteobacteria bacterium]MDE2622242.1 glycoside hydrolase [Betaproteobacteria bacterium]